MRIPGFTSTRSKRPEALFGSVDGVPARLVRAKGCRVWDEVGREYLDTVMALGAIGLGYAHPAVTEAAERAMRDGAVGSLAPVVEEELAEELCGVMPGAERVLFFKTGAEAVAAAVRLARAYTGREHVLTCGYHGWHDWCQQGLGVPAAVRALRSEIPFNDVAALRRTVAGDSPPAAIVVEPVIDVAPDPAWLRAVRDVATQSGAVLVLDEIKTAFRIALGGAAERWEIEPDLMVLGKAMANGFPLAAVCGHRDLVETATRTWISSTLATEWVILAAALSVLDTYRRERVCDRLEAAGTVLLAGLERLAPAFPAMVRGVRGMPQMCHLIFSREEVSAAVAVAAARHGLLFKRNAYNFVSLAHTDDVVIEVVQRLEAALTEVERAC
jgi:glutamate-1-semialdehyde 2,1-aminomutase